MENKNYIISIEKSALAGLPVTTYTGAITLIDTEDKATAAIEELEHEKIVGFDTETRPSFRKGKLHNVALMQISGSSRCYLFRLNKIGICPALKGFLENPGIIKVGLSLHDDFSVMRRSCEINPKGFVDLQQLVKEYEINDISLQKIYAIIFGEKISKSQRLTNWEAETLTPPQQAYAALDAWACLRIYNYLKNGLFVPRLSPYRHLPAIV
ncbi:MAG: 3'-5' exonuclease domain-containing protein 2 [Muribaculaceae bacterium]|nr:3'-5' exonuclease domain-containing protein 2 [Muribaculaceae bacterium]